MTDQKVLDKTQESMIAEISPFETASNELKLKAEAQVVTNEIELASAVAIKKQITAQRKLVTDTRLSITRRFDEVKKAIMLKEQDILLPLDQGQTAISEKMLAYEEEKEQRRRMEEQRIAGLVNSVTVGDVYGFKTVEDVDAATRSLQSLPIPSADADNAEIKAARTLGLNKLADRRAYLVEQEEQRKERERLHAEAAKQSAERAEIERQKAENAAKERKIQAEKDRLEREKQRKADEETAAKAKAKRDAAEKNSVKTGLRTYRTFVITEPALVPRMYCKPDEAAIRQAINSNIEIPGVTVKEDRR